MTLDLKMVSKSINEMLWKSGKTLSSAESCTAGRISSILTSVPGSSLYYKGGITSYADEIKEELLGVDKQIIDEKSAVCEEVVIQMVKGANKLFHSDYSVAVSGFAGPTGGAEGVLIGTIWIAVGTSERIITFKLEEDEGRDKNLDSATFKAMQMLRDYLKEEEQQA